MYFTTVSLVLVLLSTTKVSSSPPRSRTTTANICSTNSSIGQAVIDAVNLSYTGMAAVKAASITGDLGGACDALAEYVIVLQSVYDGSTGYEEEDYPRTADRSDPRAGALRVG